MVLVSLHFVNIKSTNVVDLDDMAIGGVGYVDIFIC